MVESQSIQLAVRDQGDLPSVRVGVAFRIDARPAAPGPAPQVVDLGPVQRAAPEPLALPGPANRRDVADLLLGVLAAGAPASALAARAIAAYARAARPARSPATLRVRA